MILAKTNKVIEDYEKTCKETTEKVEKLLYEVTTFMGNFQCSFKSNTAATNKVIYSLGATLQTEKAALAKAQTKIQNDHSELQKSFKPILPLRRL